MSIDLRASYRLQLRPGFGFKEAAAKADYLSDLGISHLYSSPYLQAAPGSTHGYDIVNPHQINLELGGPEAHARFCQILGRYGLGQVLDIVPNHMAITGPENPWWWDVLENGPSSRYAFYFDVDWGPPETERNVILLPVLGDHYGRVLEAGRLQVKHQHGDFTIHHYDHVYPVAPRSLDTLLGAAAERSESNDLAFIADALSHLPPASVVDLATIQRRHRDKAVMGRQLARLIEQEPAVRAAIDGVVGELNTDPDALDALLQRQNYRLAFWRMAQQDLGYRRFFNINTLVGLRIEEEQVFDDTHALILGWLTEGVLDGLRVDHPDGLRDPEMYFRRLRRVRPEAWIVVEKILEPGETLPPSWPVDGTTGYDFLNRVNGLSVDSEAEEIMTRFYADFTGEETDFSTLVVEKKHLILRQDLGSDVNRLTDLFLQVCEQHRRHRDYTRNELRDALIETAVCMPVYRTYVRAKASQVSEEDARYVTEAVECAKVNRPDLEGNLFDFLRDLLLLRFQGQFETELAMRFQQFTGPIMAKGVEDTAFYCYNRLVSLNEVGGDPGQFGLSVEAFHQACLENQHQWPLTMLATSTHDTKRSEDVRARLNVLSEVPERWFEAVRRWAAMNEQYRTEEWPDRNTEYLLYQILVGAWPISVERVLTYMEKAMREAKVHTFWTNPNEAYETAAADFVRGMLDNAAFVTDLEAFVETLLEPGRINSLAQTLLKLTTPGIPDIYQGTELWDLSLVDPDNRRPVDYDLRRRLLAELKETTPKKVWSRLDEGLPKLWVIRQTLALRRRQPEWFGPNSSYRPLEVKGAHSDHVVAFARGEGAVIITPRLTVKLGGEWGDASVELPSGVWRNEFTQEQVAGGDVPVAQLLARFPVCLLSREEDRV